MARQNKKGRNELDLILEQLKKSYASDSANSLEDDLLESPKHEEDAELNEILGKIFSYEEETKKEPNITEAGSEPIADGTSLSSNQMDDEQPDDEHASVTSSGNTENSESAPVDEITFKSNIEEASESNEFEAETADAVREPEADDETVESPSSDNNKDINAVDNVLSIMFSGKSKNSKSELGGKAVESIIEDTVPEDTVTETTAEIAVEVTDETAKSAETAETDESENNIVIQSSSESLDESEAVEPEESLSSDEDIYPVDDGDVLEMPYENDVEDVEAVEIYDHETSDVEDDTVFAVADEEYSTDEEDESPQQESHADTAHEEEATAQYEPISLPHIILTRAEYTYDPLQNNFSSLGFNAPAIGKTTEKSATNSQTIEQHEKEENAGKEEGFDENDISLLLKIGYDQEIRSRVGEKKAQQVMLESDNSFTPDPTKKIFGYCGKELTNRKQIPEIREKYKTNQKNLIILLSVVSVLSLMLLYITFSFEFFTNKVSSFPIFLLMDFTLVLVIMAVLYKKLISGITKLIKLETSPNTLLFFIATAYALYTIFSLIAYAIGSGTVAEGDLMLFGFAVSIYALLALVSDLLNCIKERRAFNIISSSDTLYTAEKSNIKVGNKTSYGAESNYKIRKTKLVSGYFRKNSYNDSLGIKPMYLLGIVPIVSLALGLATYFLSSSISLCVSVVMLSLMLCVPLPFVFTPTLIRFILLNPSTDKKAAYIGNAAPEEMSKTTGFTFCDRDCIEILGYTEIHPSNRSDTNESLQIAYKIFSALGGPLSAIGNSELSGGESKSHDVVINHIANDGIDIYYNSSVNVLLGDKHYMQSHNIKVKTDTNLYAATKGSDKSVIFMAFDGVPKLGFIINSRISPKFMSISESLIKSGLKVCIQSYEPQINDLYFEQNKGQFMSSVNVIKPDHYESSETSDMCDGCVVSATDGFELAQLIAESPKISKHLKINRLVNIGILASCILAALIIAVITTHTSLLFDGIDVLTNHLTTVFNALMAASLIPVIFEIVAIFKKKN